jgi:flagellar hook-basal body complex protein FliE
MIKNFSQIQNTLKNYDVNNWSKSVEVGNRIDTKQGFQEKVDGSKSFGDFLMDSISEVNSLQNQADNAVQKLASGESKNLHETLLAVEKAEIAFKTMNQIRSKVIDAYREIMKMQV